MRKTAVTMAAQLLLSLTAAAYVAIVNKTDYEAIHIVPAPENVVIDGDLGDWDMSGAIELFLDESSRAQMSVTGAYMYDDSGFYVGGHVKDPTPMMNAHHFGSEPGMVWDGDCVQLRLISNPAVKSKASLQTGAHMSEEDQKYVCHLDLWYSTQDQKPGFHARYTLKFADMKLNPPDVDMAYTKDADGKGYTFEYRIPWKYLRLEEPWQGGDTIQTQWQVHWGDAQGKHVKTGLTDVRAKDSGDLGYMGPSSWGGGIVHAEGNLKLDEKDELNRAAGHIPIKFKLDKAAQVSLAVTDETGRIIRTCLGAEPHDAGTHVYMWDGLNDCDEPVSGGAYQWKLLVQDDFEQRYVCDVGVSGNPPYQTEDGTGGWAGDYAYPCFVDAEDDLIVLGTGSCEAAPGTIGVSLEGQKLWGAHWGAKGSWTLRNGDGYYTTWGGHLSRFDARKGQLKAFANGQSQVLIVDPEDADHDKRRAAWGGMTFVGETLVVANTFDNALYLIDPETAEVRERIRLEGGPYGLATSPDGDLYAAIGKRIGRYDLAKKAFRPLTPVLPHVRHLDCDTEGNVYAAVWGDAMQVWKFSPKGKLLQKFGKDGGRPAVGTFDSQGMLRPHDIAVDRNDRLWVAEFDDQPRRYSVWNSDGSLWKEFYGSQVYSTQAYIDPSKPDEVYAQQVRFRVDYEAGDWSVDRTMMRPFTWEIPDEGEGKPELKFEFPASPGGQRDARFATVDGRRFVFFPSPRRNAVYEIIDDRYVPRLFMTTGRGLKNARNWADSNNDGKFQREEAFAPGTFSHIDSELNLYRLQGTRWANQGGKKTSEPYSIERVPFTGFNANGGPTWADFDAPETAVTDTDGGAVSGFMVDDQGRFFTLVSGGTLPRGQRAQGSGHRIAAFAPDGRKMWEYHNVHCAFAWTSDAYTPGYVVGAFRMHETSTERLLSIPGYYGQYFLLDKETGLFVAALGQDQRTPYTMDHTMVLTENFNGTIWQHPESGKIYYSGGDADCRIWELQGLDELVIREGEVQVDTKQVAQAEKNAEQAGLAQKAAMGLLKEAKLKKLVNAAADGAYDEWSAVQPQTILLANQRSAMAQLGYDAKHLWVRFKVTDESPLRNQASDFHNLFKTGDALDIQFCTDTGKRQVHGQNQQEMRVGDARILVTRTHDDKMVATIIRYRTDDDQKPRQHTYESPVWKQTVDEVAQLNALPMHCKDVDGGYVVEVGVPWTVIGTQPKAGLKLRGDLGVIYGNRGGTKNAIRYMWSDKSPEVSINNDVPSEMRIHPNDMGIWMVE